MDKLPVFEMVIDPNETSDVEVSFIALVDKPAIEKNFLAFQDQFVIPTEGESKDDFIARCIPVLVKEGKDQTQATAICYSLWDTNKFSQNFQVVNEDEQIISGPAMIADTLIYRKDANGEYNVFFSPETIKQIAIKFFKKDYQKNINLFHDPTLSLDGVTIFESFVSNKTRGIQAMKGFEKLPDGSWFISAKVDNPDIWAKIKSGDLKGFSVEGIFAYQKKIKTDEEKIFDVLNGTLSKNSHLLKSDIMSTIKEMVSGFKKKFFATDVPVPAPTGPTAPTAPAPAQLSTDYTLKDGTIISCDKLEVGGTAMIGAAPAAAGDYELADGTKLTIGEGGLITAITPVATTDTPAQQMQKMQADIKKFATGTLDERIVNLETIAKALMEYNFGWQIIEVEQKALNDAAILAYKTGFAEQKTKVEAAEKKVTEMEAASKKQTETITGLFEIVEQIAATETAEPKEEKISFTKQMGYPDKNEKLQELFQRFKKLKTA